MTITAIIRRLTRYLSPRLGLVTLILLLAVAQAGLQLSRPWPVKYAVDGLISHASMPQWWTWATQGVAPWVQLAALGGAIVVIIVLQSAVSLLALRLSISLGHAMVRQLRAQLYEHLQKLSLSFHRKHRPADLLKRLAVDTFSIQGLINNQLLPTLSAILMLLMMLAIMLRLDWQMALLALGVGPLLMICIIRVSKRVDNTATQSQEADSHVYHTIEQGLGAIALVQAHNQERQQLAQFEKASDRGLAANLKLYITQGLFSMMVEAITAIATAALLIVGVMHVWRDTLTLGTLLLFMAYLASLYQPIDTIAQNICWAHASMAGLRRVFELLDLEPDVADRPGAKGIKQSQGHIVFDHVSFGYDPQRPILRDVSFEVKPGQRVAIVGSTGSGKTTLLGLAMRFFDPQIGRVLLDGTDLRDLKVADVRAQNTMVLQEPILLAASVADNLRFGLGDVSTEAMQVAAGKALAGDFIAELPDGLQTVLGSAGMTLSGGQRQRLGLTRAFLRTTPLFLFDEPTSALDASTEARISERLATHTAGSTTIIVTHRLAMARQADKILVMQEGQIAEQGTHEELLALGGIYHRFVCDAQQLRYTGEPGEKPAAAAS